MFITNTPVSTGAGIEATAFRQVPAPGPDTVSGYERTGLTDEDKPVR